MAGAAPNGTQTGKQRSIVPVIQTKEKKEGNEFKRNE